MEGCGMEGTDERNSLPPSDCRDCACAPLTVESGSGVWSHRTTPKRVFAQSSVCGVVCGARALARPRERCRCTRTMGCGSHAPSVPTLTVKCVW
eukprot:3325214-Prymnesium_polylepis.1